jgi:hypothetical protein
VIALHTLMFDELGELADLIAGVGIWRRLSCSCRAVSAVRSKDQSVTSERAAVDRASRDLRVFISNRESRCDDCGDDLGRHAMILLAGDRGALCLTCADLDHLTFLPPGDAALTGRARKYSTLAAVVLKWSRGRKRYERQGLLVEEQALDRAEAECWSDAEARARRRDRERETVHGTGR